jgi:ribokinase
VVVKLGGEGSLVFAPYLDHPMHVPAVSVQSVDPTGAGDAFCGAFAVSYGQDGDLLEAACRATVAASFVVEQRGALAVLPFDCSAAEQRLALLRDALDTPGVEEVHRPCAWTNVS